MTRRLESPELRSANDRRARKDRQMQDYRTRIGKRRDRRRQLDLIVAGVTKHWLCRYD